jgi:hypothetical protein
MRFFLRPPPVYLIDFRQSTIATRTRNVHAEMNAYDVKRASPTTAIPSRHSVNILTITMPGTTIGNKSHMMHRQARITGGDSAIAASRAIARMP